MNGIFEKINSISDDGTSSFSTASLPTYANFYGFLKNLEFFDGDIVQPVMAAIERAQQM